MGEASLSASRVDPDTVASGWQAPGVSAAAFRRPTPWRAHSTTASDASFSTRTTWPGGTARWSPCWRRSSTAAGAGTSTSSARDSPLPFIARLQPAFAGSLVIGALPVLAILVSSLRPASLALFALRETVAIGVGTVVAALIPAARRRQSFAYGLLLPVAVALVSLLARGPAVEPPR